MNGGDQAGGVPGRLWAAWTGWCNSPRSGTIAGLVLAAACLVYLGVCLYLARGVTFTIDELSYFSESDGFAPGALADPFEGHLTAVTRFIYAASLGVFGADHLPLQVITLLSVVAVAILMYALVSRWIGSVAALGPALIMLFLGSTPTVLQGNATMWAHAVAFGLAAFVAFDRGGRRWDIVACAMLVLGVLSLELGLAFALGVAIWALARGEPRRLWVAAVPAAVYAVWWLWALKFDEGLMTVSNVLLIPAFTAEALAAAAAAAAGLGIDFAEPALSVVRADWGPVVVAALVAAGAIGIRIRGRIDPAVWAAIGFVLAFGVAGAMAYGPLRSPDSARYLYPFVAGLLIALAACWRGPGLGPRGIAIVLGIAALTLPANLWLLRERGNALQENSDRTEAALGAIELGRETVDPDFSVAITVPVEARLYLAAADEHGSLGLGPAALASAPPVVRQTVDSILDQIASPQLLPVPEDVEVRCNDGRTSTEIPLSTGGNVLQSDAGAAVQLRRFADEPSIDVGTLVPGTPSVLLLPGDASSAPWVASANGAELELCEADVPEDAAAAFLQPAGPGA